MLGLSWNLEANQKCTKTRIRPFRIAYKKLSKDQLPPNTTCKGVSIMDGVKKPEKGMPPGLPILCYHWSRDLLTLSYHIRDEMFTIETETNIEHKSW